MSSLTEIYQQRLQQPDMAHDNAQSQAVEELDKLCELLNDEYASPSGCSGLCGMFPPWFPLFQPARINGMYLWGDVGRGKTWLMNLFYQQLEFEQKTRIHFHHFMLGIHEKLDQVKQQKNPLKKIARELARKYRVLCIDEFIVTNITDAMILSELLHELFNHRVCIVATSNRVPGDLYLNGLQRERFLPAIELIRKHTEVFQLDGGTDHRVALLEQSDLYYSPVADDTDDRIHHRMMELSVTPVVANQPITILGRIVQTRYQSEDIIWFDFEMICTEPRAAQDYIELAKHFDTLIITNIPMMDEYDDDRARRFIYLIDELYDRNVKLLASADAPAKKLYSGNMLEFAFRRTVSRLIEMRSHQYLSKPHVSEQ